MRFSSVGVVFRLMEQLKKEQYRGKERKVPNDQLTERKGEKGGHKEMNLNIWDGL